MKRSLWVVGLALLVAAPVSAQEEGHRQYRYRSQVEMTHRKFARMGREYGRMGREYGRIGREYARMHGRNFSRQWSRRDFGREFRNFSRDMHRDWSRMGREFQMRPRRGDI